MKLHIGGDKDIGLTNSTIVTAACLHASTLCQSCCMPRNKRLEETARALAGLRLANIFCAVVPRA